MIYEYAADANHDIQDSTFLVTVHFRKQVSDKLYMIQTTSGNAPQWAQALWRLPGVKCITVEPYSVRIERMHGTNWQSLLPKITALLETHLPKH